MSNVVNTPRVQWRDGVKQAWRTITGNRIARQLLLPVFFLGFAILHLRTRFLQG